MLKSLPQIAPMLIAALSFLAASEAFAIPHVTQLNADLEMKDFHDTISAGPLRQGTPLVLTFKNKSVVKVTPLEITETTIRLQTELLKGAGHVLYDSVFVTRYNSDAELSEKTPSGDLVYRLKLNPRTQ